MVHVENEWILQREYPSAPVHGDDTERSDKDADLSTDSVPTDVQILLYAAHQKLNRGTGYRPMGWSALMREERESDVALTAMATASTTAQADVLNVIFNGLKSRSHDARLQSALELRRYARTTPGLGCACSPYY
jgi:hypothetical protein